MPSRPLQVIRVAVESTQQDEAGAPATLRVAGTGAQTPTPFRITGAAPGESRGYELAVAVTGPPGTIRPVTVIAETPAGRFEQDARITVAEPGWTMWMVSHFHYDPVWWSTQGQFTESRLVLPDEDGDLPDARTAFDLVRLHIEKARRDGDYKFVLAEIDYLKPYFDAFPADRAELRGLIAAGRVELVGGTYNEPNTNLTSAETTIRNAVYGMGFQRDIMGADPRSAWMLDAFGFDPGFPGLMAGAGLTSSSWARGPFHQWGPEDNARMQFPAEFEWLSPDGTGLLTAYMANHYGAGWTLHTTPDLAAAEQAAYEQFRSLAAVAATKNVLLPVGSDHVIPARWVTDVHRSWNEKYLWPRFVTAIPRDFFDAVRAEAASVRLLAPRLVLVLVRGVDHAADAGHEPALHRQGRLVRRHQAGAAGGGDGGRRGRAAGDARLAGGSALPGRVAGQGVAAARLRGAPRRDHRHRVRPGVPGPAGRLARGVAARRRGAARRNRFHRWRLGAGGGGGSGGGGSGGGSVASARSRWSTGWLVSATAWPRSPSGWTNQGPRGSRCTARTATWCRRWPRVSGGTTTGRWPR